MLLSVLPGPACVRCSIQVHLFYSHLEPYPVRQTLHGLSQNQGGEPHHTLDRAAGDGHGSLLGSLHGDRPGIQKINALRHVLKFRSSKY